MGTPNRYDELRRRHERLTGRSEGPRPAADSAPAAPAPPAAAPLRPESPPAPAAAAPAVAPVPARPPRPSRSRSLLVALVVVVAVVTVLVAAAGGWWLWHQRPWAAPSVPPDEPPGQPASGGGSGGTGEAGPAPAAAAAWLIMVYLDGDNNLDPALAEDVAEMEAAGSTDRVRTVVLWDRAATAPWSTVRRFLVRRASAPAADGTVRHCWEPEPGYCEDLGEANMGDPNTLRGFVEWGQATYPARQCALIISNHGGGWREALARAVTPGSRDAVMGTDAGPLRRGIAWDDSNGGDFLETREVRAALEPVAPLAIIGADACLMAMVEVAYEWQGCARYLVASEELEPGDGWPYDRILSELNAEPDMAPEDLARRIVESYGAWSASRGVPTTLSAVDLQRVPDLVRGLDQVAGELLEAGRAFSLTGDTPGLMPFPRKDNGRGFGFYDLESVLRVAQGQATRSPGPALQAALHLLREAVLANHSEPALGGRGLAIYGGGGTDDAFYNPEILRFARDTRWDELLAAMRTRAGASPVAAAAPPQRWAVLIGVQEFADPKIPPLRYCAQDVRAVRETLVTRAGYGEDHVVELIDRQATLARVRSELGTDLPKRVGPNDLVLLYFSGHGCAEPAITGRQADGTEKYLLLTDSRVDNLYATALPMSELARICDRIQADKLLFAMDACYSGAAGSRGLSREGMKAVGLSDDYLGALAASQGVAVLTSSRASEVSMESSDLQQGLFTSAFCRALRGDADADRDAIVSLTELYQFVSVQVPAAAKKLGASQTPVLKGEITGVFPLAEAGRQPVPAAARP